PARLLLLQALASHPAANRWKCSRPPSQSLGSGGRFCTCAARATSARRGLYNGGKIRFSLRGLLLSFFLRLRFGFLLLAFFVRLEHFHIRNVDRAFALCNFALRIVLRFTQVLLNNPHTFDEHLLLARNHFE